MPRTLTTLLGLALLAFPGACGGSGEAADAAPPVIDGPPMQSTTLLHDDGVVDQAFSLFDEELGAQVAVRFTPPAHPAYVDSAEFFVADGFGKPTTLFRVRVYGESTETGLPDAVLLGSAVDVAAAQGDTWVVVDLTEYGVVVEQGEFFVAMEWLVTPGPAGANAQFLGADLSDPNRRSYFTRADSEDWGRIVNFTDGHDLDFMIRATVSYPITP